MSKFCPATIGNRDLREGADGSARMSPSAFCHARQSPVNAGAARETSGSLRSRDGFSASKAGMHQTTQETTHPDDLLKSDLLSEILLLGGGTAVVLALLMVVVVTFGSWFFQS
jgi:hypothetical protein